MATLNSNHYPGDEAKYAGFIYKFERKIYVLHSKTPNELLANPILVKNQNALNVIPRLLTDFTGFVAYYDKIKITSEVTPASNIALKRYSGKIFGLKSAVPLTFTDETISSLLRSPSGVMDLVSRLPDNLFDLTGANQNQRSPIEAVKLKAGIYYRFKGRDYEFPIYSDGKVALPARPTNIFDDPRSPLAVMPWLDDAKQRLSDGDAICILFEYPNAHEVTLTLCKECAHVTPNIEPLMSQENGELHLLMAIWEVFSSRLGASPFTGGSADDQRGAK